MLHLQEVLTGVFRAVRKFQKKDCSVAKLVGTGNSLCEPAPGLD